MYTHARSATRMVVSRWSWVRRGLATSRGGVPSGVTTRGSWAHTVVYVADGSYSSDRWEPHSRSLTMTRVFTITPALICVCSASLASQASANPITPNLRCPEVRRLASPSLRPHCRESGLWSAPLWNNLRGRTIMWPLGLRADRATLGESPVEPASNQARSRTRFEKVNLSCNANPANYV